MDASTLELLGLVLDQAPAVRLLVLMTARPEFRPPWGPRSHLVQITVTRFTRAQTELMVERLTGGRGLPSEVLGQMIAKTDGVPLFVEELTKLVLESGLVREAGDRYDLVGSLPPLAIPATLHDSLQGAAGGIYRPFLLGLVAEAQGRAGQTDAGLCVITEALALNEASGERCWEADLHRQRGVLLFASGDGAGAEESFRRAIETARRQRARSFELRAATSLSRLWLAQGKGEEARRLLEDSYHWFTEGFDTRDLQEAGALLGQPDPEPCDHRAAHRPSSPFEPTPWGSQCPSSLGCSRPSRQVGSSTRGEGKLRAERLQAPHLPQLL